MVRQNDGFDRFGFGWWMMDLDDGFDREFFIVQSIEIGNVQETGDTKFSSLILGKINLSVMGKC